MLAKFCNNGTEEGKYIYLAMMHCMENTTIVHEVSAMTTLQNSVHILLAVMQWRMV